MRLALYLLIFSALASGQICRVTNLSPAQPPLKVEEGERALESQTFQTNALALGPGDLPHFFDAVSRIRRVEANGRVTTVAGTGFRAERLDVAGPARETPLPNVTQILFSPAGVLHFIGAGRVYRMVEGRVEIVAGSGRPGFNGEAGPAVEVNLGGIVHAVFDNAGSLLLIDGFARVRRLFEDGTIRTIAGSTRPAAAAGFTGDDGPAVAASLSNPRQIVPLADGSFWIRDLGGRHLRVVTPDGIIRTVNRNFETSVNILKLRDGTPGAATANRVYPIRPDGNIATGSNPFSPFTGTPLAVGADGALFFLGSTRPEQRNPLVRMLGAVQTVVAGAPVAATVDGQAAPFAVWNPRTGTLLYATALGNKAGIVEARAGATPRFVVGGGDDITDADGKAATALTIFGIVAFSVDGEGRIVVADVYRRRILVVGSDGKVAVLKDQGGAQIVYTPTGTLGSLQRIAADGEGNVYWFSQGATPTGGVFTAEITAWRRADASMRTIRVQGLAGLGRQEDGSAAVLAGNGANFRTLYRLEIDRLGAASHEMRLLPLASTSRFRGVPYFNAAGRLFRGAPGSLQMLDYPNLPSGAPFAPDYLVASAEAVIVHSSDGGFYRIENPDDCTWLNQPVIARGGIVNAASYEYTDTISPRQLITIFGSGLGPAEGQGLVLDGVLRAGGQPAPYPALLLGNFSGANPQATLTGTAMPVIHSNDRQVTVQAVTTTPAGGEYLLYFSWQGLQLIHPDTVKVRAATPGLFTATGERDGLAAALNEDGSVHGPANGAAPGQLIQLYGTGFGALDTNLALGDFHPATALTRTTAGVTATIDGEPAPVEFAGGAPGAVGGLYQVNVRLPEGLAPGAHRLAISVTGEAAAAAQRVTIYVK